MMLRKIFKNKLSPRCKYVIWVIFIIFLIFPIVISIKNDFHSISSEENIQNLDSKFSFIEKQNNNKINTLFIEEIVVSFIVISICLCCSISLLTFIVSIYLYIIINYKSGNSIERDERINRILNKCKEKLGIKRNIKIIKQDFIRSPAIMGIFNIKILITNDIFILSDIELECIFMHELSHYKRKDTIMNEIIIFIKSIYFFNPTIGKLIKHMKLDMETATDELAISKLKDIKDAEYCDVLIKMNNLCDSKSEYMLGLVDKESKLEYRVNTILDNEKFAKSNNSIFTYIILVIVFMIFLLYPSSYGEYETPKLNLELSDGTGIDIEKESNIKLTNNSNIKILSNDSDSIKRISYEELKLDTEEYYFKYIGLGDEIYYESGQYICKVILKCKSGENISYEINIIVE